MPKARSEKQRIADEAEKATLVKFRRQEQAYRRFRDAYINYITLRVELDDMMHSDNIDVDEAHGLADHVSAQHFLLIDAELNARFVGITARKIDEFKLQLDQYIENEGDFEYHRRLRAAKHQRDVLSGKEEASDEGELFELEPEE